MDIKPSEIESVEQIGQLDGVAVKMIKTIGGFWIAVGKPKNKSSAEALAAGSHPAIVKYSIAKQYADFQPSLAKSENTQMLEDVTGYTENLPKSMRDKGYDMYALKKNESVQYVLTKHGAEVHSFRAEITPESIKFAKANKPLSEELKGFSRAVGEVATKMALSSGKKYVEHEDRKFCAKKLSRG